MDLRTALRQAAEQAPITETADRAWELGRRRRRARHLGAVMAVVLVLLAGVLLPQLAGRLHLPVGEEKPRSGSLGAPYGWALGFENAPNGPVLATWMQGGVFFGDPQAVSVGQDGSYRVFAEANGPSMLSPNGRYLARADALLDLTTGVYRRLDFPFTPLAWSADGRALLMAVGAGLQVYKVDDFSTVQLGRFPVEDPLRLASFAPDGTRLIVQFDSSKTWQVFDFRTETWGRSIGIPDGTRLGGQAAWGPDGRITVVAMEDCAGVECRHAQRWHLGWLDPQTGELSPERVQGRSLTPRDLVGWRGGEPVFTTRTVPAQLVAATSDGGFRTLLTTEGTAAELDVARHAVERGEFGDYGPAWPGSPRMWGFLLLAVLPVAGLLAWRLRSRQRHRGELTSLSEQHPA